MKGPAADPQRLGVFIPTGDQFAAERLAFQLATMLNMTTHDGRKYTWPPRSQRENSAGLHQLRLDLETHSPYFVPMCSCGWNSDGTPVAYPGDATQSWISHLMTEGIL